MLHEELKSSAVGFGFDAGWISELLEKWGQDVLAIVIEAARNGLSVVLIVEIMNKLGPAILELIVELLNRNKMTGFGVTSEGELIPGPVIEGIDGPFIDMIIEKYLPVIIEKYLPLIFEKYGTQLIQFIIEMFLKNLQK